MKFANPHTRPITLRWRRKGDKTPRSVTVPPGTGIPGMKPPIDAIELQEQDVSALRASRGASAVLSALKELPGG